MGEAKADMGGESNKPKLRVALTGATSDLGTLLLPRLLADPDVDSILALDIAKPQDHEKISYRRVDLTRHDAESELVEALTEEKVDALYHLAFLLGPRRNAAFAHEVEVAGTHRVLSAVAQAKVPRLIVPSTTALYGAHGQHPALLPEASALVASPPSRFLRDKLEVERQVTAFREKHPETTVVVLRLAPLVGPTVNNPVTRFLTRKLVPTLMGFDPLWQAVHEEDAARALHLALRAPHGGDYNVVGRGVLPLSRMIREAGGSAVPLPGPVARAAIRAINASGARVLPIPMLDYIHYSWVADGSRAESELGFVPRHHARDAVASLRRAV